MYLLIFTTILLVYCQFATIRESLLSIGTEYKPGSPGCLEIRFNSLYSTEFMNASSAPHRYLRIP